MFTEDGQPLGFWDENFISDTAIIPEGVVEVSSEQRDELLANPVTRRWQNGNVVEYSPPQMPVNLPAYAAAKRWEREVSGTVWNGWPVLSDRESQSKIIAEAVAIEKGERVDGDPWKFADGEFRPLTNEQMDELAAAVRLHVRNSYGIEAQVLAAIEAGAITTEAQIDAAFTS